MEGYGTGLGAIDQQRARERATMGSGTWAGGEIPTADLSPMAAVLARIADRIHSIEQITDGLNRRLSAVLLPDPPRPAEASNRSRDMPPVPFLMALDEIDRLLAVRCEVLASIQSRIVV